jgi:hypothetical protein
MFKGNEESLLRSETAPRRADSFRHDEISIELVRFASLGPLRCSKEMKKAFFAQKPRRGRRAG